MTHQPSFAHAEFATKKKTTRREKFLARMEALIPWAQLLVVIEPFYPKGQRGRPPVRCQANSFLPHKTANPVGQLCFSSILRP